MWLPIHVAAETASLSYRATEMFLAPCRPKSQRPYFDTWTLELAKFTRRIAMGKAQKKNKKAKARAAVDPLGGGAMAVDSANVEVEGPALPILNKVWLTTLCPPNDSRSQITFAPLLQLRSLEADDRAWAATALSNLVLDAALRKQLLAGGAVDGLLLLLTDLKPEVAVEAAGALRYADTFLVRSCGVEDIQTHFQKSCSSRWSGCMR